jgi:hypothetical protein
LWAKKPPQPPLTDPPSVSSLLQIYCRADCRTGSNAAPSPGGNLPYTHNLLHFARRRRMMNL